MLASGWNDLVDVDERLEAVRAVRPTANFEPLAASFKRIRNILRQAQFEGSRAPLREDLLEAGPEAELFGAVTATRIQLAPLAYRGRLEAISELRPALDLYFDKVLVNVPDPAIRQNRLTLLHSILAEFSTIADFSEIVTNFQ